MLQIKIGTATPWGIADQVEKLGVGVYKIGTASHGGIYVAPEIRRKWNAKYRDYVPFAGSGWYEEDCDVYVVILAMPELFPGEDMKTASEAAEYWCFGKGNSRVEES